MPLSLSPAKSDKNNILLSFEFAVEGKICSSSFLFFSFFPAVIFSVSTFRINTNNQIMFVISGKRIIFNQFFSFWLEHLADVNCFSLSGMRKLND